ncbi:AAA family ATPase [Novosphingobium sediminicola]|uniref:Mrp family chromosome partitioning ATPase n=1 Tax=Novosphingobium sediminicola TaxID=563162 RepID=A0A7W6CEM5_9SPHN|nr:AAA family ATPase [Novosphingobium sediminicola]MBB3955141.1 Mrp family chromosome partitioning ATPase [Novosphingobium sediminicola]
MNEPLKNQDFPQKPEESHSSLIQRAMQAFDRGQFVPPSGPADLLPPSLTPQAPVQAAPVQAPIVPQAPAQPYAPAPIVAPVAPPPQYGGQTYGEQAAHAPQFAPQQPAYAPAAPAPSFHRINHQRLALEGFAVPGGGANAQVEEFRLVKRQLLEQIEDLRRQGAGVEAQAILVTSALPEEGKTFVAINLAMSIAAEKDSEVVLVDLDMARSSVLSTLGLPSGPGLVDAIADPRIDVRDLVIKTDLGGLSVLPGGRPTASDSEYLASARAKAVLARLVEGHPNRVVVFDTPPVLAAALAVEVAKLSAQTVLVVKAEKTSGSAVQDAAGLLSAGCPNVQALLNGVQFSPSGRRFGTYHNYRG